MKFRAEGRSPLIMQKLCNIFLFYQNNSSIYLVILSDFDNLKQGIILDFV